jgi:hypothetical protein
MEPYEIDVSPVSILEEPSDLFEIQPCRIMLLCLLRE